ncbi:MAG: apoptosis regulator Bcl-2 [Desulfovibrionaceae bacterium]|nr:apoptosis regulator Bcl-2 [Desulfovibrionaceae bacterium]
MNRRDFLSGRFAFGKQESAPSSGFGSRGTEAGMMLPPEFSPAMLKAQARQLGLDPDTMSEEEIALAVIKAMNAQRPG